MRAGTLAVRQADATCGPLHARRPPLQKPKASPAISRGSSAATPTDATFPHIGIPKGCQLTTQAVVVESVPATFRRSGRPTLCRPPFPDFQMSVLGVESVKNSSARSKFRKTWIFIGNATRKRYYSRCAAYHATIPRSPAKAPPHRHTHHGTQYYPGFSDFSAFGGVLPCRQERGPRIAPSHLSAYQKFSQLRQLRRLAELSHLKKSQVF